MRMAEQAEEQRRAAEQAAVTARAAEQARKAALAEERRLKVEAEVQVRPGGISASHGFALQLLCRFPSRPRRSQRQRRAIRNVIML